MEIERRAVRRWVFLLLSAVLAGVGLLVVVLLLLFK